MVKECNAKLNPTIPCDGIFIASQGLCLRHACLFDIWLAEHNGWKVYAYTGNGKAGDTPTIGSTNPASLRAWKRGKFHDWLNTLTIAQVERMLHDKPRTGEW